MHRPPPAPMPDSAVVGGAWLTVVGCSMRSTLPANEFGSAASAGLPASPVSTTSVVGLVKINAPVLPVGALGDAGQDRLGDVAVGDADHPVVGRAC